jgi:hypothetical protein
MFRPKYTNSTIIIYNSVQQRVVIIDISNLKGEFPVTKVQ